MTQTQSLAVSNNWLNTTTNAANGWTMYPVGDPIISPVTIYPLGPATYPIPSYCYHYTGPARPIKLTLSEVERLRAAAKRDAKLKAILAKFTDQIEVAVDFE